MRRNTASAASDLRVTGHQPLGADLRGAADQTAVGVAIDAPDGSILSAHVIGLVYSLSEY
ncbi:hypothetical protein [Methylicorpusculum sp.]|uniref:hypothetical protein n=1 Tax=Methylicorpusculum sp. TaxID=2713644 RepID=UPI002ABB80DE|nr:hypothetical protein [Methylicorpusculum sp.]MDZ4150172.1 hypothetical protein [Methylicorpusculum sp.]